MRTKNFSTLHVRKLWKFPPSPETKFTKNNTVNPIDIDKTATTMKSSQKEAIREVYQRFIKILVGRQFG